MKNPMKALAVTNLILLVGLIVFIMVAKQRTDGEKVGYFLPKPDDSETANA